MAKILYNWTILTYYIPDMNAILKLLCDVTEYDEMPVRHNEDGVNEEMASSLPIRVTAHRLVR